MRRLIYLFFICIPGSCPAQEFSVVALGLQTPVVSCTPVKDQSLSSTCWSFSSNSFLESECMKKGLGKTDLSEMFVARYSMIRKIRLHLILKGQNFFTPGGQFHDALWVLKQYGMVPEEAYPGRPRGERAHNHAELDTLLSRFVRDCVKRGITEMDNRQSAFVDSVLDHYLGPVPAQFTYAGQVYTPRRFADEYLQLNPDDFAEITSYTHHPYYTKFVLEDKYNWTGDAYENVSLDDFSRITDAALQKGYSVGWDGDADDPYFRYYQGLAWLPGTIRDFTQARQDAFNDKTTLLDHMMHIVGVSLDRYGEKWYYIKNSWGDDTNLLHGFVFMREDYFRIRTVAIIVNKKAVPADIRERLGWK